MKEQPITTLFLDIGGVLLTNGWDRSSRALAAKQFNIELTEMDERHHLCFDSYERGRISMDEYLKLVVFYEPRDFTPEAFKKFIYTQSKPLAGSIDFFKSLKAKYHLKVLAVNNEAKEINEFRIREFKLHELFDGFVSSCYVGFRKPDTDIYRFACNIAQVLPKHILVIDDRSMFVEVAGNIGLNTILFDNLDTVKEKIKQLRFS